MKHRKFKALADEAAARQASSRHQRRKEAKLAKSPNKHTEQRRPKRK